MAARGLLLIFHRIQAAAILAVVYVVLWAAGIVVKLQTRWDGRRIVGVIE